jgi:hypothetical protein
MEYDEGNYLSIAGLQHCAFCRCQWALAYIEIVLMDDSAIKRALLLGFV